MQAADAGFADLLAQRRDGDGDLDRRLRKVAAEVEDVMRRAKAQGALRDDVEMADVALLLAANAGVISATRGVAPGAWERFAALMLDALRAEPRVPPS
jgi:hypothetical protein